MKRRNVLGGAAAVAGTSLVAAPPALGQRNRQLTMVTDWPEGPGVLPSARRLADAIERASDGRLRVEVHAAGELVRPFETFDAVQHGVADMFHSHFGYFGDKSPAFHFYSGVPFGLTPGELLAWVRFGGGQELWDTLGAEFGIKPLLCCSTGIQMGGWFRREIREIGDFRGLRYRMAGLGADVYRELGAAVLLLSPADIVEALRSGAIDACEWTGPWLDMAMGLHEVAEHYYYPGWHEPTGAVSLGVNRQVWDSLDETDRRLIEVAAAGEYSASLAEFSARNADALGRLRAEGRVRLHRFDDEMMRSFAAIGTEVVAAAGAADPHARHVFASYTAFRRSIRDWSAVAQAAYLDARQTAP